MNTSRREFLSTLAVAGAVLPVAARAAEKTEKKAKGAPVYTTTVPAGTIHVFSKPMHMFSFADTARMIAEAGYGGIEYTVRVPQGHVLPERVEEDLPKAVEAAKAAGLKVEMITTDISSAREKHTEKVLRTAAKLGVKYYRLGAFSYDEKLGVWGSLQKLKPVFKELADLNQSAGIHGAIQNHAGTRVGAALWDSYELVRDLDPKWIGVQYDIRHATAEGGQSWSLPLKLLAPWIKCTDIKDFKWTQGTGKADIDNVPVGEGIVPFDAYFKLVRELNIGGPLSVHLEYAPFEKTQMSDAEKRAKFPALMKKDLEALKAAMAKHKIV
ncbi:MAG TPA: sugar phosphate isomerase/epimerase family protein [Polyangiaceae bacterium]|nr:sugar phosphate isomerase/epimerase family protein [Polyangiaceae bacterium]